MIRFQKTASDKSGGIIFVTSGRGGGDAFHGIPKGCRESGEPLRGGRARARCRDLAAGCRVAGANRPIKKDLWIIVGRCDVEPFVTSKKTATPTALKESTIRRMIFERRIPVVRLGRSVGNKVENVVQTATENGRVFTEFFRTLVARGLSPRLSTLSLPGSSGPGRFSSAYPKGLDSCHSSSPAK